MVLLSFTQLACIQKKIVEPNNKASYVLRSVCCSCQYTLLVLVYTCMLGEQDVSIQTAIATGFYGDSTHVCAYVRMCFTLSHNRQIEKLESIRRRGKDWIWHEDIERYFQMGVRKEKVVAPWWHWWTTKFPSTGGRRMLSSKADRTHMKKWAWSIEH